MKLRKSIILITFLLPTIIGTSTASIAYAEANMIHESSTVNVSNTFNADEYTKDIENFVQNTYQQNTDPSFLLKAIKSKIKTDVVKYGSQFENQIRNLWGAYFLYDFAFVGDSKFYPLLNQVIQMINPDAGQPINYGNLPDTQIKTMDTINPENGKPQKLVSYYIDQKSNKTVLIHGGFRGNWDQGNATPELKTFYDKGFNILIVDSRATGKSEGDYVTYGAYESQDILAWINKEVSDKPNQQLLLYGGSMGAASMMSTLSYNIPNNVKGIIENCGFSNIRNQLEYTYSSTLAPLFEKYGSYMGIFLGINPATDLNLNRSNEQVLLNTLNQYYIKPKINLDIDGNLPIVGMKNTPNLPKLFIHGEQDDIVPFSNLKVLMDANLSYESSFTVPGAGHGEAQIKDPSGYENAVASFLNTVFNSKITINYKDNTGKVLKQSKILVGTYGSKVEVPDQNIEGYILISKPTTLVFNEKNQEIDLVYKKGKETSSVTVKYVDEVGKEIAKADTLAGKVGETYTAKAKTIDGYTLKTTPTNATGTYSDQAQTVTFIYDKNSHNTNQSNDDTSSSDTNNSSTASNKPDQHKRTDLKQSKLPQTDTDNALTTLLSVIGVLTIGLTAVVRLFERKNKNSRS